MSFKEEIFIDNFAGGGGAYVEIYYQVLYRASGGYR